MMSGGGTWIEWMKRAGILIPLLMLTTGCETLAEWMGPVGLTVEPELPRFPPPKPGVIDTIQSCATPDVDEWIVQLSTLCRELEEDC